MIYSDDDDDTIIEEKNEELSHVSESNSQSEASKSNSQSHSQSENSKSNHSMKAQDGNDEVLPTLKLSHYWMPVSTEGLSPASIKSMITKDKSIKEIELPCIS